MNTLKIPIDSSHYAERNYTQHAPLARWQIGVPNIPVHCIGHTAGRIIMIFIQLQEASERALMLVLRFPTGRNKASLCLVPVWPVWAESYIIEVVFWLFLSKTRHAFQTTAFTELVTGLPVVLRARESSFSTNTGRV